MKELTENKDMISIGKIGKQVPKKKELLNLI